MAQPTTGTAEAPTASDPLFGGKPSLPYHGTTGHAPGAGASAERAHREAADGTATARQQRYLAYLSDAGPMGLAWTEISRKTGEHHGQVSGALSSLHAEGRVAVLRGERRDKSGVYVLPQYVQGRDTRPFRGRGGARADVPEESVAEQGRALAEARAEIERLRGLLASGTGHTVVTEAPEPRPRLTDEERVLVDNIENGLNRRRDAGIFNLRRKSAEMLVAALRRLDGEQPK